jgi:hypothetical protein
VEAKSESIHHLVVCSRSQRQRRRLVGRLQHRQCRQALQRGERQQMPQHRDDRSCQVGLVAVVIVVVFVPFELVLEVKELDV